MTISPAILGLLAVCVAEQVAHGEDCTPPADVANCFCDAAIQTLGLDGIYVGRIERPRQNFLFRVEEAFGGEGRPSTNMVGDLLPLDELPSSFSPIDRFLAYTPPPVEPNKPLVLFKIVDGKVSSSVKLDASTSPVFSCAEWVSYDSVAMAMLGADCRAEIHEQLGATLPSCTGGGGCSGTTVPGHWLIAALILGLWLTRCGVRSGWRA